jgi:4-diphosphocytidyl-2-C-methyl-D-erythritol kinase
VLIKARAYAKINWLLEIGQLRPDNYHELSTLFQTINLYDELFFSLANNISLKIVDEKSSANLPTDNRNLVIKAANLLASCLSKPLGANIELKKSIPLGGGLGGGSADAAITLLALNKLWQAELKQTELIELAAKLGSDVPFFLIGGTAWGKGRGTEISVAPDINAPYLLLVNPGIEISTSSVYLEFDRLTNYGQMSTLATYFFTSRETLFAKVNNSLSPMAKAICPTVAVVETKLAELGAEAVLMSGSGATVWAHFPSAISQENAYQALASSGWLVVKSHAISHQEYQQNLLQII